MTLRPWLCAVAAALVLLHDTALAAPQKAWAYAGWWMPDSWRTAPLAQLDRLLFFELKVNAAGEIAERNGWPEKWGDLRAAVKRHSVPLDLTLTLFDPKAFEQLFSSAAATRRLLDAATALAASDGVAGLQLDFEIYTVVRPATLENYQVFVRELSRLLQRQSPARNLSVFFPIGGETLLYDAATLTKLHHVVLQGYDAHWASGKMAGPVAPLDGSEAVTWKKAVATGVALGIPKNRLLLSFPLYGYEWRVKTGKPRSEVAGHGKTTSFTPLPAGLVADIQASVQERVHRFGAFHDPASASSYYQFKNSDGHLIEGWFEDWWSLSRKSDYLEREGLGGIAFFILGYDNDQLINYYLRRNAPGSKQASRP